MNESAWFHFFCKFWKRSTTIQTIYIYREQVAVLQPGFWVQLAGLRVSQGWGGSGGKYDLSMINVSSFFVGSILDDDSRWRNLARGLKPQTFPQVHLVACDQLPHMISPSNSCGGLPGMGRIHLKCYTEESWEIQSAAGRTSAFTHMYVRVCIYIYTVHISTHTYIYIYF